ncbi:homoserine dehydrogenase [Hydrogenimonas urashimensis]|uniref:homoserine dehydrogenase n=1 Tax=Hydrogenimonas urashimensis TaxID=2740515 RepID=UPI001916BE77|nr:homoserine dehydrogenase [Hydrogenimonas urashimensis]
MVQIGIIGVGTVGASVAQILENNRDIISARAGKEIVVKKGVVRNLSRARDVNIPLTDRVEEVLEDPKIDIVVELMGGVEEPYRVVRKALENGKAVVTANKALLAYHRYELQEVARDLPFEYEASVAGGIPIIKALREGLSANHIESIKGIINGTANYILTKMMTEGADFAPTLKEAQELGYAEADPTFDIGGFDAAHKLLILASIAYGIDAKPEDILIEGIESVTQEDIGFAKEFGYTIKLLGIAKKVGEFVELRVHPALVPQREMIAKVEGVMNGISVIGDKVGETMYYGPGAGGDATASAVISDIIAIARGGKSSPMLGFKRPLESGLKLLAKEAVVSKYYLRLEVADRPGVLAKVSQVMGEERISIETMLQRPGSGESASLLLATHACEERAMQEALKRLFELESVKERPVMIRIEN